jgi:uncharacterized protein YjfI (DUF2170 family)
MKVKTSAHYQREYRRRLRDQGLIKKEVWIRPEHSKQLLALEKQLRQLNVAADIARGQGMQESNGLWTTQSLYQALSSTELAGQAQIELIEGAEPVIHLSMTDYGDLPLFITVSGEQIVVECLLWPISEVSDVHEFNEVVLKTHKYFPLSTISLEATAQGEDCYFMFGALSHASVLNSVLIEIETLSSNVLQATEAYSEFLVTHEATEAEA